MKRSLVVAALALFSIAACTKDNAGTETKTAPVKEEGKATPAAPSGTQVADFPLVVDLPAGAVANDPLGAPGFHSEDGSISVLVAKQGEDSPKDIEAAKTSIEELLFKKWVKSEKTDSGWVLSWVGIGFNMDGDEYDNYAFEVVKKVGADSWRCSGSVKKAEHVEANLKLCNSLKAQN